MIIVSGATGFLGSRLCEMLAQAGKKVVALSSSMGDISGNEWWNKIPAGEIEHFYHCAGETFVPNSWNDPLRYIRVNALGTGSVLEFCRARKCSLTYVSAYVYGSEVSNPISESTLPKPNNPYALSKRMGEELCEFYAANFGVRVSVVRPFNIYGPGQKDNFLVPFILGQVKEGKEIRVKDLEPKRDYIYIDDVVSCIIKTAEAKEFNIFNAGTGRSVSVRELIDEIQSAAGTSLPVVSENTVRSNEISDTVADISRARTILGWLPSFSLRDGISRILKLENTKQ